MKNARILLWIGILGIFQIPGISQSQSDYPREIISWAECGLKVVQIEFVEKLAAGNETLTAGRRDARLALIKVKGQAPRSGYLSVAPNSFGAQFLYRGMNKLEISKAWGIKGKNVDTGEAIENWTSDPAAKANIGVRAGDDVGMWFAVAVPKEVKTFFVVVPALLGIDPALIH